MATKDLKQIIEAMRKQMRVFAEQLDELEAITKQMPDTPAEQTGEAFTSVAVAEELPEWPVASELPKSPPTQTSADQGSEFDNIPISAQFIQDMQFKAVLNKHLELSILLKSKMKDVIKQRLESTNIHDSKRKLMTLGFDNRNPQMLLKQKLEILDVLESLFKEGIDLLEDKALTTTPLLDLLDKLYEQDEILYNINKNARTPTHHGPIIHLIQAANEDLLNFVKAAITANQSKPT